MKKLLALAAAAAGYVYLRRSRPETARKLEAKAKETVGGLTGRSETGSQRWSDEVAGGARETTAQVG